jgi:hypothetical protein
LHQIIWCGISCLKNDDEDKLLIINDRNLFHIIHSWSSIFLEEQFGQIYVCCRPFDLICIHVLVSLFCYCPIDLQVLKCCSFSRMLRLKDLTQIRLVKKRFCKIWHLMLLYINIELETTDNLMSASFTLLSCSVLSNNRFFSFYTHERCSLIVFQSVYLTVRLAFFCALFGTSIHIHHIRF